MPEKKFRSALRPWLKRLVWLILVFLLYLIGSLIHATLTDYQPSAEVTIIPEGNAQKEVIQDSILSFLCWNVGYGGLGAESDFFYHGAGFFFSGEQMIRSPQNLVEKNNTGIRKTLQEEKADFYLLQEVDLASRRSYYFNQQEAFQEVLPGYASTMAINFDVKRVIAPIFQPWNVYGKAYSGLGTFSKYTPKQTQRFQLPGKFSWPNRLFLLDRCLAVHRFKTTWGKELYLVNLHNSAFDQDGGIKSQQMEFLKQLILKAYEAGHYVVVGGDWNQCPPGFPFDTFSPGLRKYAYDPNIASDFMPEGWQWIFDPGAPSNRSTVRKYQAEKSFTTIIDYFLISPNVEALDVKCIDQQFNYSDHQAIRATLRLK